jgi:glycosyltransferase involved in cell wall biosynthesis
MEAIGISILICTYNGENRLPKTLEAISQIFFKGKWEVLIVDNASNDKTTELVEKFFVRFPCIEGRLIKEVTPGLSYARRAGWRNAKYSIVLFCDDDNWLTKDYLSVGFEVFQKSNAIGVLGGKGIPVSDSTFPAWFKEFSHSYAVGSNQKESGKQPFGSAHYGAGCFFLKDALLKIDLMEFQFLLTDRKGTTLVSGGDVELCFLVQLLGYELWFEERLEFYHEIVESRLKWPYYLKLKKGIASSFPLLYSYKGLFEGTNHTFQLALLIIQKFWTAIKGYLLCQYRARFQPSLRNEVQLIESQIKIQGFFKNFRSTLSHFAYLKKTINNLKT